MHIHEMTDKMLIDDYKRFHDGKEPEPAALNVILVTRDLCRTSYVLGLMDGKSASACGNECADSRRASQCDS